MEAPPNSVLTNVASGSQVYVDLRSRFRLEGSQSVEIVLLSRKPKTLHRLNATPALSNVQPSGQLALMTTTKAWLLSNLKYVSYYPD